MKRLFAVALVVTMANASTAFAGESLLSVGTRHVQQIAVSAPAAPAASTEAPKGAQPAAAYQGQGGTISRSGMGKGKKAMLFIGLAAVFVAGVYTIDQNVLDVTPSSLGTRQD